MLLAKNYLIENPELILFAAGGVFTLILIGIFAFVLTRKDKH